MSNRREPLMCGKRQLRPRSELALLSENLAAEGNAPVEGHDRKVGAASPFLLCPRLNGGSKTRQRLLQEVQDFEVVRNGSQAEAILGPFRAQLQKLHHARKVPPRGESVNAGYVAHFLGQRIAGRRGRERAAVGYKEHQQRDYGNRKNERRHHRATASKRAGSSRDSSVWRNMVNVHVNGSRQPIAPDIYCTTEYRLLRFVSAQQAA